MSFFDFTGNNGTGSWKLRSGTTANDRIYYTGNDVYMSSRKTSANDLADNQIYNKIKFLLVLIITRKRQFVN